MTSPITSFPISTTPAPVGDTPSAVAGPAAIPGVAFNYMRADGAPAVQLGSASQKGIVQVDGTTITAVGGVITAPAPSVPTSGNPTATAGPTVINGGAATFMRSDAAPAIQLGTSSQKGLLQVDGTSISVSSGIISLATTANAFRAINVFPSGDNTGATDHSNIVAAITSAASLCIPIYLNTGTWYNNATIVIPSNVVIIGAGNSSLPSGGGTTAGGTVINSLVNASCFAVQVASGTATSWAIKNLVINTPSSGSSAVGILLDSCQRGDLDNIGINVQGASQIGLLLRPSQGTNCDNNNINNVIINLSTTASSTAISVTSASTSYNTSFVYFTNTQLFLGANTQKGLYLGLTDSVQFHDLTMVGLTAGLAPLCIQFDYTAGFAGWPSTTHFFGLDHGFNMVAGAGRVTNVGSPSGAVPNVMYAFSQANADVLPSLANLNIVGDNFVLVSGSLGYAGGSGAGGQVTQLTSITTGVMINTICGQITTVSNAFVANTATAFAVTNSQIAATDVVICSIALGATIVIQATAYAVTNGSFSIALNPLQTGTTVAIINFAIIKAVNT